MAIEGYRDGCLDMCIISLCWLATICGFESALGVDAESTELPGKGWQLLGIYCAVETGHC